MKVDGMCDISPTDRELKIKDKKLQENQGRRLFLGGRYLWFSNTNITWCSNEDGVSIRFVVSVVGCRTG